MCDICACSSHWNAFFPSLPSQRSLWIMWLGEVGVARLPPQQLHLYWYVQKLLEKKVK